MDKVTHFFSPTKRAVAANTISQLIGKGVSVVSTFIVTLVIARRFGAAGYGDFVKITTYIAFFYLLVDFGINAIYLQKSDVKESWAALVWLRAVGGFVLMALSVFILMLIPSTSTFQGYTPFVRLGILLYSPTIFLQGLITTANAIFQKRLRYDLATWAIFFGSVVMISLLGACILYAPDAPLLPAIIALEVGTLVTAAASFFWAQKLAHSPLVPFSMQSMSKLFVPALPLGVTLLFNLVYFHADSVVITLTRPTSEVGLYGLAYKVFEVVLVFPTFFMNAVYPVLLAQQNKELGIRNKEFKRVVKISSLFMILTSVFIIPVIWFAAPLLTFIKDDFAPSIGALRVLSLGLPFFFLSSLTMWALIAKKKQKTLAVIYGTSMIVNVLGNIALVPMYGYMAAAWITVVSEGLVLVLSGIILLKENIV